MNILEWSIDLRNINPEHTMLIAAYILMVSFFVRIVWVLWTNSWATDKLEACKEDTKRLLTPYGLTLHTVEFHPDTPTTDIQYSTFKEAKKGLPSRIAYRYLKRASRTSDDSKRSQIVGHIEAHCYRIHSQYEQEQQRRATI